MKEDEQAGHVRTEHNSHYPPFSSRPEQVGPQDNGNVTGRHLVYSLVLRQQRQKLDQVPDRQKADAQNRDKSKKLADF